MSAAHASEQGAVARALEALNAILSYSKDEGGDWRVYDVAQSAITALSQRPTPAMDGQQRPTWWVGEHHVQEVPSEAKNQTYVHNYENQRNHQGEQAVGKWTVEYSVLISPKGNRYRLEDDGQTGQHPSKRLLDEINAVLSETGRGEQDMKRLIEFLRSVHTWFMQQAPEHYNGCGLWIDVDAELAEHPRDNCILDVDSPTLPPERDEYLQCGCVDCRKHLSKTRQEP